VNELAKVSQSKGLVAAGVGIRFWLGFTIYDPTLAISTGTTIASIWTAYFVATTLSALKQAREANDSDG